MCLIVGEGKWPSEVAVILAGPSPPERLVHVCSTRLRHALSENGRQMGRAGAGGVVRRVRIHSFRDFDSMAMRLTGEPIVRGNVVQADRRGVKILK